MLIKEKYSSIQSNILLKLSNELSKNLTYHTVQHTLDILKNAERIARDENIHSEEDIYLLKVACLYHDSGFLFSYKGHEEESCKLAKKELPGFNLTTKQLDIICGLIIATKIPQTPRNKLEEIICDADLDYLGTEDFFQDQQHLIFGIKKQANGYNKKGMECDPGKFLKKTSLLYGNEYKVTRTTKVTTS